MPTSLTIQFDRKSLLRDGLEGYVQLELDSRVAPTGFKYFRLYAYLFNSVSVVAASGDINLSGPDTEEVDTLAEFNESLSYDLPPQSSLVEAEVLTKFIDEEGKLFNPSVGYDSKNYQVILNKKGSGILRLRYRVSFMLYTFRFAKAPDGTSKVGYVGAIEEEFRKVTKLVINPSDTASSTSDDGIQIESDPTNPTRIAKPGLTTLDQSLVAVSGFCVYDLYSINVTSIRGVARLSPGFYSREEIQTLVFNNSDSSQITHPASNGVVIDEVRALSRYSNFIGPGQVYDDGNELAVVGSKSVVHVDSFGRRQPVTAVLVVRYTTQFQKGEFAFEYDSSKKEFLSGIILVKSGSRSGSMNVPPPSLKGSR